MPNLIQQPTLYLGTAMWGWTVPPATAFALLDHFYAAGGREVDAATNYPINKQPADFRRSENILHDWLTANGVRDLRITMKVGSVNNLRTPEINLSKSFLLFCLDEYRTKFGDNLATFMVHWDNREDAGAIAETISALDVARDHGLAIGLSGILHPDLYARQLPTLPPDFRIQLKHNLLQSDYARYAPFHGHRVFVAYGINAGGRKLDTTAYRPDAGLLARGGDLTEEPPQLVAARRLLEQFSAGSNRPRPTQLNHLGLLFAAYHPDMAGILIGPSRVEQLADSLGWMKTLGEYDYSDIYRSLNVIADATN